MGVREIPAEDITSTIRRLCIGANTILGDDVIEACKKGLNKEESPMGKVIFRQLMENSRISKEEGIPLCPLCQDTGLAVVFVEIGQDAHIVLGGLSDSINEEVGRG